MNNPKTLEEIKKLFPQFEWKSGRNAKTLMGTFDVEDQLLPIRIHFSGNNVVIKKSLKGTHWYCEDDYETFFTDDIKTVQKWYKKYASLKNFK